MIKKGTMMKFEGIIITFLMTSVVLLAGCTSNNQNSNGNQNIPVSYPVFSTVDHDIFNTAYEEYDTLRNSMNASDARMQLLDTLNNDTEGVAVAELGLDGSTIFVTFSDGDFALVDTFELDEVPGQGTGFSYQVNGEGQSDDYLQRNTAFFDSVPPETSGYTSGNFPGKINYDLIIVGVKNKTTCTSKKVLVLAPCYWEFNKQPTDACISLFKAQGWTDGDITLKLVREHPSDANFDCTTLAPSDYFNLDKYGIVLFTGHGAIKVHNNYEEDNLYLQFIYADNASFLNNPQLQQWKDEKKLAIGREYRAGTAKPSRYIYEMYIRADLLRQEVGTLPSSFVCFATCYGGFLNKIYLEKGAQVFLGWDNSVASYHADGNMLSMVQNMLEHDLCVYDAYANHSVVKSYNMKDPDSPIRGLITKPTPTEPAYPLEVKFDIYPNPSSDDISLKFYFPAWIDKLTITNIPDEADSLNVTLFSGTGNRLKWKSYSVSSSTIHIEGLDNVLFLANGTPKIQVKAFDGNGKELATGQDTGVVSAGANSKQINLTGNEDRKHVEYVYYLDYNITIDLTLSSNKWETGKEIMATATCSCEPIGDAEYYSVTGFTFILKGARGEVVAYDPPFPAEEEYGYIKNGSQAMANWGSKTTQGYGSPATFTATFRLEGKEEDQPYIEARFNLWETSSHFAKIYLR